MESDARTSENGFGPMRLFKSRKFGRLVQQALRSNLGTVLDISAGGMAVRGKVVPEGEVLVEIPGHPLPGPLRARMVWWRKSGFFTKDVGLQFLDVSPEMARRLCAIASANRKSAAA